MFTDFYNAWHFLIEHKVFKDPKGGEWFKESLHIMVVKVNPETETIEDYQSSNSETRVWLEIGPYVIEEDYKGLTHDIDLDCGGKTFEEAIINLANLVKKKYGD